MEDFTNETIDTLNLPRYEDTALTPLHPSYLTVIWFNIAVLFGTIAIIAGAILYFAENARNYWVPVATGYFVTLVFTIIIRIISFKNKGFAFRTYDVIYRSGAISTTTTVVPYSRVQHVAQHEGLVARWLGLATVEIFTAGGAGGDIKIPGLEKAQAAALKQLLVGKIENKQESVTPVPDTSAKENDDETPLEHTGNAGG